MSTAFNNWCDTNGITRQHTVKATPQQNGVSEQLNRTLAEGVIAMLNQAGLPMSFWAYTVLYYTDILNSTPSLSVSNATSYEVWHGHKPDLSPYRTFGCRAFVNIHHKERKNLASHTDPCIFVGLKKATRDGGVTTPYKKQP